MLSLLWICCFFWRPDNKCILQVQLPPSDEKKKVIDDVNKDRRFAIDAFLVRIMKSRKIMTHQNLVAACVEQLSRMFKVLTLFCFYHICVICLFCLYNRSCLSLDFLFWENIMMYWHWVVSLCCSLTSKWSREGLRTLSRENTWSAM